MGDPTRDDVRDALYDELRVWLVDPLTPGDEGAAEDFEQCVANVWAIVTDPQTVRALLAGAPRPRVLLRGWVCDEGGGDGELTIAVEDDDPAVLPDYGVRLAVMLDTAQRVCPVCRIERYDNEEDINDDEADTIGPFGMSATCPKCGSDATPVITVHEDTETPACACSPRGSDGGPERDCPLHGDQGATPRLDELMAQLDASVTEANAARDRLVADRLRAALSLAQQMGQAYRGDWSNFDGRALRNATQLLDEVASGDLTPDRYREMQGLCPSGRGHWSDYCDGCRLAEEDGTDADPA